MVAKRLKPSTEYSSIRSVQGRRAYTLHLCNKNIIFLNFFRIKIEHIIDVFIPLATFSMRNLMLWNNLKTCSVISFVINYISFFTFNYHDYITISKSVTGIEILSRLNHFIRGSDADLICHVNIGRVWNMPKQTQMYFKGLSYQWYLTCITF